MSIIFKGLEFVKKWLGKVLDKFFFIFQNYDVNKCILNDSYLYLLLQLMFSLTLAKGNLSRLSPARVMPIANFLSF